MEMRLKVMELLKKVFPKPIFPQKRYLLLLITIVYMGAKCYVEHTPDPFDDEVLEAAHELVLQIVSDAKENDSFAILTSPAADENQLDPHYGESA